MQGKKLQGKNRVVLARAAAAVLVEEAACRPDRQLWDRQEKLHAAARTCEAARAAAEPLVEICATCPHQAGRCAEWAEVDQYTGIAAGRAWVNGKERPVHWIARQSPGRLAS